MKYSDQLEDRRWLLRRREILKRDNFKCTNCGEGQKLQVHHLYYVAKRMAWDYPDFALTTLCDQCHKEHTFSECPPDFETVLDVMLSVGGTKSFEFACDIHDFSNHYSVTHAQIISAMHWLIKKPGTLLPLIAEVEEVEAMKTHAN